MKGYLSFVRQISAINAPKAITGYRTKRVGFIGDGASKLLAPSLF